jgi:hypothetical protein
MNWLDWLMLIGGLVLGGLLAHWIYKIRRQMRKAYFEETIQELEDIEKKYESTNLVDLRDIGNEQLRKFRNRNSKKE